MRERQVGLVLDAGRPPAVALRRLAERLDRLLEAAGVEVAEAMVVVGWVGTGTSRVQNNPDGLADS